MLKIDLDFVPGGTSDGPTEVTTCGEKRWRATKWVQPYVYEPHSIGLGESR